LVGISILPGQAGKRTAAKLTRKAAQAVEHKIGYREEQVE
jgi:hypothetical protein